MKKIFIIFFIVPLLLCGCSKNSNKSFKIVSTIYPSYDFVRAVVGQEGDIENIMLLSPGEEVHDFEPTPKDIININNCDLFIYVGGESDSWVLEILDDLDSDVKVIKMMDAVSLVDEEIVEGMEEHHDEEEEETEYDEHVWTSPYNAIKIIDKIYDEIILIDSSNKDIYTDNKDKYIDELQKIDEEIFDVVKNGKRDTLIFGDRFPLKYFTDRYNLKYYAAFPGCSHDTEASAKTISFLIDKVKSSNIPVVFKTELSSGKIASIISEEAKTKVLEFNSCHNISRDDFNSGVTYVDLMKKNIDVLKEALN